MQTPTDFCLIYSLFPDVSSASATARALVQAQLVACCNVLPGITSHYRWQGALQESQEVLMLSKTSVALAPAVMARLASLHPYETPAILQLPIQAGTADFLRWMSENLPTSHAIDA